MDTAANLAQAELEQRGVPREDACPAEVVLGPGDLFPCVLVRGHAAAHEYETVGRLLGG